MITDEMKEGAHVTCTDLLYEIRMWQKFLLLCHKSHI